MSNHEDLIEAIPGIRKNLAEEIDAEEWANARVSMRQLSDALDQLGKRMVETEDVDAYNELRDVHAAALDQWNDAYEQWKNAMKEQR